MVLRSLYHKPEGERLIGKVIVGWTWLLAVIRLDFKSLKYNYSHEELWIPDENGWFDTGQVRREGIWQTNVSGQCFSSTTRGDSKGVRFAPAREVLHHPERWDYIEFEVPDEEYIRLVTWMRCQVDRKYDFAGVVGFVIPVIPQARNKWYCSEICCAIKRRLGIMEHQKIISPRRSALLMVPDWGGPVGL